MYNLGHKLKAASLKNVNVSIIEHQCLNPWLDALLHSSTNPKKNTMDSTKTLSSTTVFTIDNKTCFLSTEYAFYNYF